MPQLPRSGITCPSSFSQRGETGCRATALQQPAPPPVPNSLRPSPALPVLGMGREPRLCCRRDQHLAPPNKPHHPIRTQPRTPGEERLATPALQPGDSIQRDLSNGPGLQRRRGWGGTGSSSMGSAPCSGSTVSSPAHLEMAWLWPLMLLGSIKPSAMAGLAKHTDAANQSKPHAAHVL